MRQHQLSALINLIIRAYFNNTFCVIHYHDDPINLVRLDSAPIFIRQSHDTRELYLDALQLCRIFLLQCEHAREAFESTEEFLKLTSNESVYNDRRYVVIVEDATEFADFFNSFILTFVRDILVIYAPGENVDRVTGLMDAYIYSSPSRDDDEDNVTEYRLFTHKYVGREGNNDPMLLDIFYTENHTFHYNNDLFPDKVSDQHGRELRAPCVNRMPYAYCRPLSSEIIYGNEHNIVIKYAERFNMTLNIYSNETFNGTGYISANWTGSGLVGRLILDDDDYADIVYGGFPARIHVDLIKSVLYWYEVSVPLPNIKYGFLMFVQAFHWYVWLLIIALFLTTRALVFAHRTLILPPSESKRHESRMSGISIYAMMLSQSTSLSEDIRGSKFLKGIVVLLLFASLLYVTAYNSRLASVMINPVLEDNVETLQELAASDLKLLFFDKYYKLLAEDERKVYRTIYKKIELIADNKNYELSKKMLASRRYAVARYRRRNGEYFESNEHLKQMRRKFKPIAPELFANYYYLLLRKNSMHTPELRKLSNEAEEAGLLKFWEESALRLSNEMTFQKEMQEYTIVSQNVDLNLLHLKGIFACWACGMAISFLVFLKEICAKRANKLSFHSDSN